MCSKEKPEEKFPEKVAQKDINKSSVILVAPVPTKTEETHKQQQRYNGGHDGSTRSKGNIKPNSGSEFPAKDKEERANDVGKEDKSSHTKIAKVDSGDKGLQGNGKDKGMQPNRIVGSPGGPRGEQVAAGWPSWLTSVAGEAIQGLLPRGADSFEKLEKVSPYN